MYIMEKLLTLTCYAFYSFSFVYILYSTAVIWRINFIIKCSTLDINILICFRQVAHQQ